MLGLAPNSANLASVPLLAASPLSGAHVRDQHFAYYHPEHRLPPVSDESIKATVDALQEPIYSVEDLLKNLGIVGPALPTLKYFSDAVRQDTVQFQLYEGERIQADFLGVNPPTITWPHGRALFDTHQNFSDFIQAAGFVAHHPAGLELPPSLPDGSYDAIRAGLWTYISWIWAKSASFIFQITHEMDVADLVMQQLGSHESLLDPGLTCLFDKFRNGGLAAAADFYRHVILKPDEAWFDSKCADIADRIKDGGVQATGAAGWEAPHSGLQLYLAPTKLDERVNERLPYEAGPSRSLGWNLSPIDSYGRDSIRPLIENAYISNSQGLEMVRGLIMDLAPELYLQLFSNNVPVRTEIVLAQPQQAMPVWTYHPSDVGLASDTPRFLYIRPEIPLVAALRYIVMAYGAHTMPLSLNRPVHHDYVQVTHDSVDELFNHLQLSFYRNHTWGYAVFFEFVRQAGFRRISIPLTESEEIFKQQFDRAGLSLTAAFLHQDASHPDEDAIARRMMEAAKTILQKKTYQVQI